MTRSRTGARYARALATPVGPPCLGSAAVVTELDLELGDGRTLHAYDTHPGATDGVAVCWHHGTPNIGAPPTPLFAAADRLGLRWVSYDRPGYGGSTPLPGRNIASGAADTAAVADALGIDRLAVMGHSGGGPHAIACGALLADRVIGVVSTAGLAPFDAEGLDWFAGMAASGVASLRAAAAGARRRSGSKRPASSTTRSSPRPTWPCSKATGRGSVTSSARRWRPGPAV